MWTLNSEDTVWYVDVVDETSLFVSDEEFWSCDGNAGLNLETFKMNTDNFSDHLSAQSAKLRNGQNLSQLASFKVMSYKIIHTSMSK